MLGNWEAHTLALMAVELVLCAVFIYSIRCHRRMQRELRATSDRLDHFNRTGEWLQERKEGERP
jgi:hypothetical protein